jgi:hypothetical protein
MSVIESVSSSRPDIAAAMGFSADSLYEKCSAIASNLWWSWHHEAINVFRDLDPIAWRKLDQADNELNRFTGVAIQCTSYGG